VSISGNSEPFVEQIPPAKRTLQVHQTLRRRILLGALVAGARGHLREGGAQAGSANLRAIQPACSTLTQKPRARHRVQVGESCSAIPRRIRRRRAVVRSV